MHATSRPHAATRAGAAELRQPVPAARCRGALQRAARQQQQQHRDVATAAGLPPPGGATGSSSSGGGGATSVSTLCPRQQQPCHQQQQQQQPEGAGCTCGIVVVDHGSRRAASNEMLEQFCRLYQQLTGHAIVEPAHMEIAEPSIAQAIGRCVAAGARRVVVAPYFLSRGRHIQDDIPALVAQAQAQHPGVACSIAEPIGIDPLMVQLIQSRVAAVLARDGCLSMPDNTAAGGLAPVKAEAAAGQQR